MERVKTLTEDLCEGFLKSIREGREPELIAQLVQIPSNVERAISIRLEADSPRGFSVKFTKEMSSNILKFLKNHYQKEMEVFKKRINQRVSNNVVIENKG